MPRASSDTNPRKSLGQGVPPAFRVGKRVFCGAALKLLTVGPSNKRHCGRREMTDKFHEELLGELEILFAEELDRCAEQTDLAALTDALLTHVRLTLGGLMIYFAEGDAVHDAGRACRKRRILATRSAVRAEWREELFAELHAAFARALSTHLWHEPSSGIAAELTRLIRSLFAGQSIYFPRAIATLKERRDREIRAAFNGKNYGRLALRYGLSCIQIRKIINGARRCTQGDKTK